jgi:hypothetical protein
MELHTAAQTPPPPPSPASKAGRAGKGRGRGGNSRRKPDGAGVKGGKGGGRPSANTAQYDGRMVYVSTSDEAKAVARKITGASMENAHHGFPVYLFAVRAASVNTSVKASAIAQRCTFLASAPIGCA